MIFGGYSIRAIFKRLPEFELFIQELLEPLEKDMSADEIETVKEIAYVAAHSAERYGFKLGARFMAKLLQEVFEMPE